MFSLKLSSETVRRFAFLKVRKASELSFFALPAWLVQVIRFSLVGIANTMLDAGAYIFLSRLGLVPNLVLAKALSYSIGLLNSFYWNKSWTFHTHAKTSRVFPLFVAANLLAIGLNTWMMHLALWTLGLPEVGALALATGTTFAWNFISSKFFIFR